MDDDRQAQKDLQRLEEEMPPLTLTLSPGRSAMLVALLQLTCRHPGNLGASRDLAEEVGRRLQDALARHSEALGRVLERGWHEVFDVPRSGR